MDLTEEQEKICDKIMEWLREVVPNSPFIYNNFTTIGGYAGTGKTFLIGEIRKRFNDLLGNKYTCVAFVTFTGKASSVLKARLEESNSIRKYDYVGTIHSLIYKPICKFDKDLQRVVIVGWEKRDLEGVYDLILIDEASMISEEIWSDLLSFRIPIIAVGDHGQLPPVGDDNFNLMKKPDYRLEKIYRQASSSPIISLSSFIREKGFIPYKIFSKEVFKLSWKYDRCKTIWDNIEFDDSIIVLCGFNKSRVALNHIIRNRLDFVKEEPYPGERIICLKNNHYTKIMNGQIGTLMWVMPHNKNNWRMTVQIDGMNEPYEGLVNMSCFGVENYDVMFDKEKFNKNEVKKFLKGTNFGNIDFFDFGYTISVHKSQGSEWSRVVLFEQRSRYWDDEFYRRWLYTAVTRAKEKLFVISDYY